MAKEVQLCAIAAMCSGNGIAIDNRLPWNLPKEYEYFMKVATRTKEPGKRNALIMGRLTWDALESDFRPIGDCLNIVLSKSLGSVNQLGKVKNAESLDNCEIYQSLDEALQALRPRLDRIESVYAVGGTQVYRDTLRSPLFKRFYLTRVLAEFKECNVFIEPRDFLDSLRRLESDELVNESQLYDCKYNQAHLENGLEYIFEVYEANKN